MGRWRIAENQPRVFRDETTDKHYVASNHFQADRIVTVLDAYEQRIAELEEERDAAVEFAHSAEQAFCAANTELARVKAESLRVVPVPDEGNLYDWYMTPTGLGCPGKDRKQNNCIESAEGYYRLDECQPVRLERWEDDTHATGN